MGSVWAAALLSLCFFYVRRYLNDMQIYRLMLVSLISKLLLQSLLMQRTDASLISAK